MAMVKTGVVAAKETDVEVVGVSCDGGAKICSDCKRIILANQIKEGGICPFCKSDKLEDSE